MHAQERIPIQLICRFPCPASPADSRPTPLTSPTLGSSRRLSPARGDASLLVPVLLSPEETPDDSCPLTADEACAEAAARDAAEDRTGALDGV